MCRFYVDISFQHLWIDTKEHHCWITWEEYSFIAKLPHCLPKWLYHFPFLPATNENSCCSASSPVFGSVRVLGVGHSSKHVVASCFHAFIWISSSICVSPLVRWLVKLAHFKIMLYSFSAWSFNSSLYILDNSPLSNYRLQIFYLSTRLVFSFSWQCLSKSSF